LAPCRVMCARAPLAVGTRKASAPASRRFRRKPMTSKRIIRKTFPTLASTKNWRADTMHAVKKGTMGAPSKQTFGEAADVLPEGMKSGAVRNRNRKPYKPSVIRTYETWIDARLRDAFGGSKLADLSRNDFQDYAEELLAEGLDPSTVRNVLMPARVLYKRAVRRGDVAINPTSDLELPAVEGLRDSVADAKEADEHLAALPEDDRALSATAFYAGPRKGELQALRIEDIELDTGEINVSRSWDEVEGEIEPKSKAGTRVIPICDHLNVYLKAHLAGALTPRGSLPSSRGSRCTRRGTRSARTCTTRAS
jgi:integrase